MGVIARSMEKMIEQQQQMEILETLTERERSDLLEREERIERTQRNAYYEIGLDLRGIRDSRLYREEFGTFEEYCANRWELSHRRVNQLIDAASAVEEMGTIVPTLPTRESHVRPLLSIDKSDERAAIWSQVLDSSCGGKVTARDVEGAVEKHLAAKKKNWITLEEWNDIDSDKRADIFHTVFPGATMNRQDNTSIEWAQWSWNPVTGCKHDCPYCYARDIAERFYPQEFAPSIIPQRLRMPDNTEVPAKAEADLSFKNVFTCSMADLFGRWVPREWIEAVLESVRRNPQWNFLFLTKFPKRLAEFDFPENAWLGTTVDLQARVKNAEDAFSKISGGTKWLSLEPLLEPLKFDRLDMFDWVVIGGASRSNKTPEWVPPLDWIVELHAKAREAGCKIYYKDNTKLPDDLRLREFPWVDRAEKTVPSVFQYLKLRDKGRADG